MRGPRGTAAAATKLLEDVTESDRDDDPEANDMPFDEPVSVQWRRALELEVVIHDTMSMLLR